MSIKSKQPEFGGAKSDVGSTIVSVLEVAEGPARGTAKDLYVLHFCADCGRFFVRFFLASSWSARGLCSKVSWR